VIVLPAHTASEGAAVNPIVGEGFSVIVIPVAAESEQPAGVVIITL
jgi:hypothetical protein